MNNSRDGELVGLNYSTNGRSCATHECCGRLAFVGMCFKLRLCIVEIDGVNQEAMKAVCLLHDGNVHYEACTIGFLQRHITMGFKDKYLDKTCELMELYDFSESKHKREMSHRNGGAASFKIIDNIVALRND